VSPSPTLTAPPTALPTATRTRTPLTAPTASATPGPASGGDAVISDAAAVPSPWNGRVPLRIALLLQGDAQQVRWKLYSKALVCVRQGQLGPRSRGWSQAPLDLEATGLASNLYYLVLTAEGQGKANVCKKKLRVMILP
jgi:hypothetical protein